MVLSKGGLAPCLYYYRMNAGRFATNRTGSNGDIRVAFREIR
jgi:hypothetical protein